METGRGTVVADMSYQPRHRRNHHIDSILGRRVLPTLVMHTLVSVFEWLPVCLSRLGLAIRRECGGRGAEMVRTW